MNSATTAEFPTPSVDADLLPSSRKADWRSIIKSCHDGGAVNADSLGRLVENLAALPRAQAALAFLRQGDTPLVPVTPIVCREAAQISIPAWQQQIEPTIRSMCQRGEGIMTEQVGNGIELMVEGVGPVHHPWAVLCLFADTFSGSREAILLSLQLAAAELESWFANAHDATENSLATQQELLWNACHVTDTRQGYYQLACQLSQLFEDHFVAIGTTRGKYKCQVTGMSGNPDFTQPSPLADRCEELMAEALIRDTTRIVSRQSAKSQRTEAEEALLELCGVESLLSGPLRRGDTRVGAWIIAVKEAEPAVHPPSYWLERMSDVQPLASAAVDAIRIRRPGLVARGRKALSKVAAGRRRRWSLIAAILVGALCVPFPYKIKCTTELQPVRKRFVPAPYDGVLERVLVEPGDTVVENQVVARMDGQEMDWQLAAARAEQKRHSKEQDAATTRGDTAAAQVAQLQAEQNEIRIQMLLRQIAQLEIRSPLEGVILDGDPREMEGAHLKMGQTLFEIGPIEQMVVEVRVPDDEIAHVDLGDSVRTRLDAFPHRPLTGTITRLAPQATTLDQKNVFVAEVQLDNPQHIFRPGMKGQATITTAWRPLAWNLFHRAADKLPFWFGS